MLDLQVARSVLVPVLLARRSSLDRIGILIDDETCVESLDGGGDARIWEVIVDLVGINTVEGPKHREIVQVRCDI